MAKLLGLDKLTRLWQIVLDNGGPINAARILFRTDDLKTGTLVGQDKYGNKYYENNMYFYGRNRWVIYADKVWLDYNASQVPAEWYGWLHYKSDLPPFKDPARPNYKWMLDHTENLTGTQKAYTPYTTTKPKVIAWKPPQ